MEGVPQQDVKELDTLKEQDILAIIGMCCETVILFFQLSDVCTFIYFFNLFTRKQIQAGIKQGIL